MKYYPSPGHRSQSAKWQQGIAHVETVMLAVAPLEGIVDVCETIHARIQILQQLRVREGVPALADIAPVSLDSGGHLLTGHICSSYYTWAINAVARPINNVLFVG